jgi:hypothetical protein
MTTPDPSRSSAYKYILETLESSNPSDSQSQRFSPSASDTTSSGRFPRLPYSALQHEETLSALQALMTSMQHNLQVQLQKQQRDFEIRIKSLLIGQKGANQPTVSDTSETDSSACDPSSIPRDRPCLSRQTLAELRTRRSSTPSRSIAFPILTARRTRSIYLILNPTLSPSTTNPNLCAGLPPRSRPQICRGSRVGRRKMWKYGLSKALRSSMSTDHPFRRLSLSFQ